MTTPAPFRRAFHLAGALAIGMLLGVVAWGEGRVPMLALALPLLVAFSGTRAEAFCVAAGYATAILRFGVSFIAAWFDDRLAIGVAAVLGYALFTGVVWSVGWSGSPRLLIRALAISTAWLLALGVGIGVPGHPLIAAGYLLPGWGWAGVALAFASPSMMLAVSRRIPSQPMQRALFGGLALMLGAGGVIADRAEPFAATGRGIQPQATHWGRLQGEDDALARMQRMGATAQPLQVASVVWPESIIGRYEPALYHVLDLELLTDARRTGRTQIVGMDLPTHDQRLLNAAVAFYPDGRTATAVARQPAPIALWKPWRSRETFVADWTAHNMLALGQGDRAAVIFCFEEYVPLFYLLDEAFDAPTVYLALANTWAAQSTTAARIQTLHSLGMARLFGRPYLKAENRPQA